MAVVVRSTWIVGRKNDLRARVCVDFYKRKKIFSGDVCVPVPSMFYREKYVHWYISDVTWNSFFFVRERLKPNLKVGPSGLILASLFLIALTND